MATQSGNDEGTVEKDMSYSPSSEREQEATQDEPRRTHAFDGDVDESAVKTLPGEGGPDDAGDIEVDDEAIRARIAARNAH